jgi:hypothetical protein
MFQRASLRTSMLTLNVYFMTLHQVRNLSETSGYGFLLGFLQLYPENCMINSDIKVFKAMRISIIIFWIATSC